MFNLITVLLLACSLQMARGQNKTRKISSFIRSPAGDRQVDLSEEAVPLRRPRTIAYAERERVIKSLTIIPNESPCIHKYYQEFYRMAKSTSASAYDVLMKTTISYNDERFYYFDPEDLCIQIDDELNIDIYMYDCSKADVCECGIYMGYVDPNLVHVDHSAEFVDVDKHEKKYTAVNGLDRKLMEEDGVCVSGNKGHCTMSDDYSKVAVPLYCHSLYECVIDDSYGPILRNKKTGQTYGLCLIKGHAVAPEDNLISYQDLNQANLNNRPAAGLITVTVCLSLFPSLGL